MKADPEIFKASTQFSSVSIISCANTLELRSGTDALQSRIYIDHPHKLALKNLEYLIGILLFIPEPESILILGTGGGSLIHFLRYHYPECRITSVDYDAELQQLMHQKMLLPEADENLVYRIENAVHYLQACDQSFDLILVDLFDGNQSPDWLLQLPAIRRLHDLLGDRGAIAYNLLIDGGHGVKAFNRNLDRVFGGLSLNLSVGGYDNRLVYGFSRRSPNREMGEYLQYAATLGESHEVDYHQILSAIYSHNPVGSGVL